MVNIPIHLIWKVWEKYKVKDGWLLPSGKLYKEYNVEKEIDIATHFAKVVRQNSKRNKTEEKEIESLIEFTKKFGCLGQTINRGTPEKEKDENNRTFLFDGDLIGWALDHATFVNITLQLSYLINNPTEAFDKDETNYKGKLYNLLIDIKKIQETHGVLNIPTLIGYEKRKFDFQEIKSKTVEVAQFINEEILGFNLGKPAPVIKNQKIYYKLTSLIEWIYNEVTRNYTSQKLRQCLECHSIFFVDRDNRAHCPPLSGKGESPCASRKRVRNFRKPK